MFIVNVYVFICLLIGFANAVWYKDLASPRGLKFGDLVFRLEDTKAENRSLEDRIALRVDYGDVWIRALQSKDDDGVELGFYMNDTSEGRGKKNGNGNMGGFMVPFMIGALKAGVVTIALGKLKVLAIKALLMSKAALVISLLIVLSKYWKKRSDVEVEQFGTQSVPVYDYGGTAYSNMNNLENYGYIGSYPPSAAETSLNYALLAPSSNGSSSTVPVMIDKTHFAPVATKRRDVIRPKPAPTIFTIKRYSYPVKDLI